MSAFQGWAFLLLLATLAARGLDRPRLAPHDLRVIGVAAALAIVQRLFVDQVTLDDVFVAPIVLALPTIAAVRGGVRDGLAAAFGTWVALTIVAGAVPTVERGDLPQDAFVLATVFSTLIAGAAGSLPVRQRHLGPWFGLAWLAFFLVRDASLLLSASVGAVAVLTTAWTFVGVALLPPRAVEP